MPDPKEASDIRNLGIGICRFKRAKPRAVQCPVTPTTNSVWDKSGKGSLLAF